MLISGKTVGEGGARTPRIGPPVERIGADETSGYDVEPGARIDELMETCCVEPKQTRYIGRTSRVPPSRHSLHCRLRLSDRGTEPFPLASRWAGPTCFTRRSARLETTRGGRNVITCNRLRLVESWSPDCGQVGFRFVLLLCASPITQEHYLIIKQLRIAEIGAHPIA